MSYSKTLESTATPDLLKHFVNPFPNDKFKTSKLKEFTDDKYELVDNGRKFSKRKENTVGREEIARYEQILLFQVFSKDLYCRHVKTRACLGKG